MSEMIKMSKLDIINKELLGKLQYKAIGEIDTGSYNEILYDYLTQIVFNIDNDSNMSNHHINIDMKYKVYKHIIKFTNGVIAIRRDAPVSILRKCIYKPIVGKSTTNKVEFESIVDDICDAWKDYPSNIRATYSMNIRTSNIHKNKSTDVVAQLKECRALWVFISFDGKNSGDKNIGFLTMVGYCIENQSSIQLQQRIDRITRNTREIWVIKDAMDKGVLFAQLNSEDLLPVIGTRKFVMNLLIVVAEMDYNKLSKKANASWTSGDTLDWKNLDLMNKMHFISWSHEKGVEVECRDKNDFLDKTWKVFHAMQDNDKVVLYMMNKK